MKSILKKMLPNRVQSILRPLLLQSRTGRIFIANQRSTVRILIANRYLAGAAIEPVLTARMLIANRYLAGDGIEIGALNRPLKAPPSARVKYVDRFSLADLRQQYPELATTDVVDPDIIDDGQSLETIADSTQDFVIASHVLEHVQDPIGTLKHWMRVLKAGGVLYFILPDKRFTFDVDRPITSIDHLLRDHEEGPLWSRVQHFEEFASLAARHIPHFSTLADGETTDGSQLAARLMSTDYSIHYHVWTPRELFELLFTLRTQRSLSFDIELFLQNGEEFIFVLTKTAAPLPVPAL